MTNKATQLYEAYRDNKPLKKGVFEFKDTNEAYQVQDDVLRLKEENGEKHQGYKISLTSQETQDLFDSDSPLFGQMTDQTVQEAEGKLSLADYNEPLLELELIFLVDETVNGDDSDDEIMKKCRIAPGFEVPDGRYEDWFPKTTFHEVIADGAVNGAVIIGTSGKYTYDDLDDIEAVLYLDGEEVKRGSSTEVLGHPVNAVKWLASALENRGEKLEAGRFVSSGTFVLPERLQEGQYRVVYELLGDVHLTVTK